ncbi:ABC transporter permease [Hafnia psychrotolerans]|nr:ABC transporter permease [Hafnia psychrotolerans]
MFQVIYQYRDFITGSIKRDFQSRYQASFLGSAWLILQPVAMILVYTLIFSQVMKARLPEISGTFSYSIYLCSGLLTWSFFAETINSLQTLFITNANLLKKVSFPKICLPIIASLTSLINFCIIFGLFTLFLIVSGNFPNIYFIAIIPLLIIQMLFSIGLGVILGVMNVFVRDVGQFVTILLQFWFWFTPIVYVLNTLPVWARDLLSYNPMTNVIRSYQDIFVYQRWPNWESLIPVTIASLILCLFAYKMFKKHAADIVDEI